MEGEARKRIKTIGYDINVRSLTQTYLETIYRALGDIRVSTCLKSFKKYATKSSKVVEKIFCPTTTSYL